MPASRFNSLDGLRGIAIALVFVHNCNVIGARTDFGGHLFKGFVSIGWAGVTLFFVLSGFLITRGLRATSGSPEYLRAFFGRRVLRILPVYYLTLAVIGKEATKPGDDAAVSDKLAAIRRWPVSISYFDESKSDQPPDYVLSFDLYENGVSGSLKLDYGTFVLNAKLSKIEWLPVSACGK